MVIEEVGEEVEIWKQVPTLEPPTTPLLCKNCFVRTTVKEEKNIMMSQVEQLNDGVASLIA